MKVVEQLRKEVEGLSTKELLGFLIQKYGDKMALASSLGAEDQVLTEMITSISKDAKIFTLDTGRLFPDTYQLIHRTNVKYGIKMNLYFPEREAVEDMVKSEGINLFYDSVEKRKQCCNTRKIAPLLRAFSDLDVWICGLRKEQSVTRTEMEVVEWDSNNNMIKINPLIEWSEQDVWDYIKENGIPYNPLHDKGYPSIGCEPCTRAIMEGEDVRAGRWYWENPETKECGLHKR